MSTEEEDDLDAIFNDLDDEVSEPSQDLIRLDPKVKVSHYDAAEIIAERVLKNRFRYVNGVGWMEYANGYWHTSGTAENSIKYYIGRYISNITRDAKVRACEKDEEARQLYEFVLSRSPDLKDKDLKEVSSEDKDKAFSVYATPEEKTHATLAITQAAQSRSIDSNWSSLNTNPNLNSVRDMCKTLPGVATENEELNSKHHLLNCTNGTVNLRTGQIARHNPDDLITHMAGGAYRPGIECTTWNQALEAIPDDAREWAQVRFGQSLTGFTPSDDSLVISVGGGANGKSTIMTGILRAAGTYGKVVPSTLLLGNPNRHAQEKMMLWGLRIAILEETPEEGRLDVQTLKQTVGTPTISANYMRQNSVVFNTTHTMWINTNHTPAVETTDNGTWRRLKLLPFPYTYLSPGNEPYKENERRGDPDLRSALEHGTDVLDEVLTWAIDGAIKWFANDKKPYADPPIVDQAIKEWRGIADICQQFIDDYLVADPNTFITGENMRNAFNEYVAEMGKNKWSGQKINDRLLSSLEHSGIEITATPKKAAKIRKSETESKHTPKDTIPMKKDTPAVARIWRGVRFKTKEEQNGQATGLQSVK